MGVHAIFRIVGILAVLAPAARSNIDLFIQEAERIIGRSVRVDEMPSTRVELGYTTFDNPSYVWIQIQAGLPDNLRENVLAHELGHVVLRPRGFSSAGGLTEAGKKRDRTFMMATAEVIANCYQDPLADAEAAKRGFHPEAIGDYIAETVKKETLFDIANKKKTDDLAFDYEAAFLYCIGLRPHRFHSKELEAQFAIEPAIGEKLRKLKRELGQQGCGNPQNCFEKAKRLRDLAGFSGLIQLRNPTTQQLQ
jgi:hypothetical protein